MDNAKEYHILDSEPICAIGCVLDGVVRDLLLRGHSRGYRVGTDGRIPSRVGGKPVQLQRNEHREGEPKECNRRPVAQGYRVGHAKAAKGSRKTQIQALTTSYYHK